jgi:predicted ester cyclase
MSEEQNTIVVKRFVAEMWNQRKLDLADELFAPDCITHQLRTGADAQGSPRSPETVKREAASWFSAFPDLRFDLEQMLATDDQVVSRCTMHGHAHGQLDGNSAERKICSCTDDCDSSHS